MGALIGALVFFGLWITLDLIAIAVLRARCSWSGHKWFITYQRVGRVASCDRCEAVVVTPR